MGTDGAGRLSRRGLLGLGAAAAAVAVLSPGAASASTRATALPPRVISILNTNTGERLENVEFWSRGRYQPDALAALDRLLRDHRTDEVHEIDPRLFDLVLSVQQRVGVRGLLHVVSGYRSPETNAQLRRNDPGVARNSFHMTGEAMDLRMPGVETRNLYRAAMQENEGGVGFYARTDFIHLDVGPVRTWAPSSRDRNRSRQGQARQDAVSPPGRGGQRQADAAPAPRPAPR